MAKFLKKIGDGSIFFRKNRTVPMFLLVVSILVIDYGLTTIDLYAQDRIIAIVNKEIITQKDLNDFLNFIRMQLSTDYQGRELEAKVQAMKLNLLDKLVEDRLILQEAKKNSLQVDRNRIIARIEEIKKKFTSEEDFQNSLAQQGLVQGDLEAKIEEQMLMFNIIDIKTFMLAK